MTHETQTKELPARPPRVDELEGVVVVHVPTSPTSRVLVTVGPAARIDRVGLVRVYVEAATPLGLMRRRVCATRSRAARALGQGLERAAAAVEAFEAGMSIEDAGRMARAQDQAEAIKAERAAGRAAARTSEAPVRPAGTPPGSWLRAAASGASSSRQAPTSEEADADAPDSILAPAPGIDEADADGGS